MMTIEDLSPESRQALIACYRIAAARGRQLRLASVRVVQNSPLIIDDEQAQVEGSDYNPDSWSCAPHEPMDHHNGSPHDQRISPRVSV
jgi:hypothetical protein